MNNDTAKKIIERQANHIANLNLNLTVKEVELEEAQEKIKKLEAQLSQLQNAGQKGAEDASE